MADIWTVLNIDMDSMCALSLVELMEWRERARQRSGAEE